jgi:uncharacterized delta-60 repeat protein
MASRRRVRFVAWTAGVLLVGSALFGIGASKAAPGDPAAEVGRCGFALLGGDDGNYIYDGATDADGATIVVGYAAGNAYLLAVKFTEDGARADDWASHGVYLNNTLGAGQTALAVTYQTVGTDTDALVAGSAGGKGFVLRLTPTGDLDPTFGTNGVKVMDAGADSQVVDLAVASNGTIYVLTKTTASNPVLSRLTAAGADDATFNPGGGGKVTVGFLATRLLAQTTNVVVAGTAADAVDIIRYTSLGVADPTFNSAAVKSTPIAGPSGSTGPLPMVEDLIMNGSAILVAGTLRYSQGADLLSDSLLVQYTSAGALDSSFGSTTGIVRRDLGASESILGAGIDGNGNIVTSGISASPGEDLLTQRFTTNGAPDESFGTHGFSIFDGGGFEEGVSVGFRPDGTIVSGLSFRIIGNTNQEYIGVTGVQADPVERSAYVLDGRAGMHPIAIDGPETPCLGVGPYFSFDIANDARTRPGSKSGYILDGNGGLHPWTPGIIANAPPTAHGPYFGFDIARRFAFANADQGYILDGFGGVHGFRVGAAADPAAVSGLPYFPGFDIARDLALTADGKGGYVLDGWGGIHAFKVGAGPTPPAATGAPYFPGHDIARKLLLMPDGSGGYVLDGFGGIHRFTIGAGPTPPAVNDAPYYGFDIARDLQFYPGGGYQLDGYGGIHPFTIGAGPKPPTIKGAPYFAGDDIARAFTLDPDPPVPAP